MPDEARGSRRSLSRCQEKHTRSPLSIVSPAPCPRVPLGQGKPTARHEANLALAPFEVPEWCESQWGFFKWNTPTGTAHLLLCALHSRAFTSPSLQVTGGEFLKAEGQHRGLYPEPNAFLNTKCYTWQLFMAAIFFCICRHNIVSIM